MSLAATGANAVRFTVGLRRFLSDPITLDGARRDLTDRADRRLQRFAAVTRALDDPVSPYGRLAAHAGVTAADADRVAVADGVEAALAFLRDEGVYVSYEEFRGVEPARRGSATFRWRADDFRRRGVRADYMGGTSASTGSSVPAPKSFDHLRNVAAADLVYRAMWGVDRAPSAVWFPVLPSSAGLNNVLVQAVTGNPPERWFSHVAPRIRDIAAEKRVANRAVPPLARAFGVRLPRPQHATADDPSPVLRWAVDALGGAGRALVTSYPSSAVALARAADAAGVRLDGLVVRLGGEPTTAAKVAAMTAVGMQPANCYAFAQLGRVAGACPRCAVEELHVFEHDVAVVTRRRPRADGVEVDAFCWTALSPTSPVSLLNVENDDYGVVVEDEDRCGSELAAYGSRRRLRSIRGMSKVVAGGVTLGAEELELLVEVTLPGRFGGAAGDYQFAEIERDGVTQLVLRVAPTVAGVDAAEVISFVGAQLRRDDLGVLAHDVWRGAGAPTVERVAPRPSRAGKLLPYVPLPRPSEDPRRPGS